MKRLRAAAAWTTGAYRAGMCTTTLLAITKTEPASRLHAEVSTEYLVFLRDTPLWPPNVSATMSFCRRRHELLVTAFLASPLLDADLRAQPHLLLFATDASPSGAGACSTPVSLELWTRLYDFSDEKGCSVRLDWDMNSTPPPELRDSRAAVAGLVVDLPSVESFSYRFRYPMTHEPS